jgi:hypothetical protein
MLVVSVVQEGLVRVTPGRPQHDRALQGSTEIGG